ncbi:acyl carrier protein [Azospirillum sp. sgz301742]
MQSQLSSNGTVAQDIKRYLAEELLLGPSIGTSQPLFESGLIDSTGFVMIVSYMETHFGIVIDGDDLVPENFDTIDRMAQLIESKRAAG